MTTVVEKHEPFLANYPAFAQTLSPRQPDWLRHLRKHALERYRHLGWPGPRNEDWKFTNLAPLARIPFETAAVADRSSWVNASDQVVATVWPDPAGSPRANRSGRRCRNNTRYLARLLALAWMSIRQQWGNP